MNLTAAPPMPSRFRSCRQPPRESEARANRKGRSRLCAANMSKRPSVFCKPCNRGGWVALYGRAESAGDVLSVANHHQPHRGKVAGVRFDSRVAEHQHPARGVVRDRVLNFVFQPRMRESTISKHGTTAAVASITSSRVTVFRPRSDPSKKAISPSARG